MSLKYVLTFTGLILLAGCASQSTQPTQCNTGQFQLSANYPGAALGQCTVTGPASVKLLLTPEDEPINPSPWYGFKVSGQGTLDVLLDYGDYQHRYQPKVSSDGAKWRVLETQAQSLDETGTAFRFQVNVAGELFVSAQENRDSQWYEDWWVKLASEFPHLQRDELGLSRAGRPIWAIQTNPTAPNTLLIVGRQHPPEVSGAIALTSFVEALFIGGAKNCASLCDFHADTNVVVVPLLNPDGVDLGHWRHSLGSLDLNRDWRDFSQPETKLMRDLVDDLADRSVIRGFLDFHSTYRNVFYTQSDDDVTTPRNFAKKWLAKAEQRGVYEFENALRFTTHLGTSKNYMHGRFGIPSITYELGDETNRAEIEASSRVFAETYVQTLHPYGPVYDLVIMGGTIVDGSGAAEFIGDIAIAGDRIVYVGETLRQADEVAAQVIDATGYYVTPGFIDPHTHADDELRDPSTALNEGYLRQGVTTVFVGNDGAGQPLQEQIRALALEDLGTHVGVWIGHGALRSAIVGERDVKPSQAQMSEMAELLRKGVQNGALGFSTGLFYAPGSYAETQEVIELAKVAAQEGGAYDSHIRDESDYTVGLNAAVAEVLRIGREANIDVHIAHIKALGPVVHGKANEIIQLIEQARAEGLRVTADQYPWLASGTRLSNALVPRWAQDGGTQTMLRRLQSADEQLAQEMAANLRRRGGAEKLLITGQSEWQGQTLAEVAKQQGKTAIGSAIDVIAKGDPAVASFVMDQADVDAFMRQPWVMTGSDGSQGHPRKFGSYPHKYQEYVLARGLLSVPQFVARSTALPARTFGLCSRGLIKESYRADIAVWHPQNYRSEASYTAPEALAVGVEHLVVGGILTIHGSELTGQIGGNLLRRENCTP